MQGCEHLSGTCRQKREGVGEDHGNDEGQYQPAIADRAEPAFPGKVGREERQHEEAEITHEEPFSFVELEAE